MQVGRRAGYEYQRPAERDEQPVDRRVFAEEEMKQRSAGDADPERDYHPFRRGDAVAGGEITGVVQREEQAERGNADQGIDGRGNLKLPDDRPTLHEAPCDDLDAGGRRHRGDGAERDRRHDRHLPGEAEHVPEQQQLQSGDDRQRSQRLAEREPVHDAGDTDQAGQVELRADDGTDPSQRERRQRRKAGECLDREHPRHAGAEQYAQNEVLGARHEQQPPCEPVEGDMRRQIGDRNGEYQNESGAHRGSGLTNCLASDHAGALADD